MLCTGDIIRIAPNELSFNSPQAYRDIYNNGLKGNERFIKSKFYDTGEAILGLAQVQDPTEHSRQRRMLARAFSLSSLREQENIVHKYTDLFIRQIGRLGRPDGPGVDMKQALNWVTFDIIGTLMKGIHRMGGPEN